MPSTCSSTSTPSCIARRTKTDCLKPAEQASQSNLRPGYTKLRPLPPLELALPVGSISFLFCDSYHPRRSRLVKYQVSSGGGFPNNCQLFPEKPLGQPELYRSPKLNWSSPFNSVVNSSSVHLKKNWTWTAAQPGIELSRTEFKVNSERVECPLVKKEEDLGKTL